jgi:hypothetical protein
MSPVNTAPVRSAYPEAATPPRAFAFEAVVAVVAVVAEPAVVAFPERFPMNVAELTWLRPEMIEAVPPSGMFVDPIVIEPDVQDGVVAPFDTRT